MASEAEGPSSIKPGGDSGGRRSAPASLFAYVLAFLALLFPLRTPAPKDSAVPVSTPASMGNQSFDTALSLLYGKTGPGFSGLGTREECALLDDKDPRMQYRVSSLIATLPDPFASGLSYYFDRYLSAIQQAMAHADYVFDRGRLPWAEQLRAASSGEAKKGAPSPRFTGQPGVLLFHSKSRSQLIVVFVVGESPLEGIDKPAFESALQQGDDLPERLCVPAGEIESKNGKGQRAPTRVVKILGPSFSGSGTSLSFLTNRSYARKDRSFEIVSGAATYITQGDFGGGRDGAPAFRATVPHDAELSVAFDRYLSQRLGAKGKQVALLIEENTSYGQGQFHPSAADSADWDREKLRIPFPLHISQVRTAYAEQPPAAAAPAIALPKTLRLSLEPEGQATDVATTYSRLEPTSVDAVLDRLLAGVDAHNIRYVGIVATDVRDKIFLAREVRKNRPDVTLFTFGADILYGHPEGADVLRGMLVVAPYSLCSVDRPWTFQAPFRAQLQFPSSQAQGVFNATLVLLNRPDRLVEYGLPFEMCPYVPRRPALWVSVVGYGGLWPVTTLDVDRPEPDVPAYFYTDIPARVGDNAKGLGAGGPSTLKAPAPASVGRRSADYARLLFYPTFILCLAGVLAFARGPSLPAPYGGLFGMASRTTGPRMKNSGFVPRMLVLGALTFLGCQCTLLLTALPLSNGWSRGSTRFWLELALFAAILVAWALALAKTLSSSGSIKRIVRRWGFTGLMTPVLLGSVCASLIAATGRWASQVWLAGPADRAFLRLRAADLGSGLNPVIPLWMLMLVGVFWSLMTLHRYRLLEAFDCRHPFLNFGDRQSSGLRRLESRLQRRLGGGLWRSPIPWCAASVLVGFAVFIFGRYGTTSFDGPSFKDLYACAFVCAYLGIVITTTRVLVTWGDLRDLLRFLANHPVVESFGRVPRRLAWESVLSISGRLPHYADLNVAVRLAQGAARSIGCSSIDGDLAAASSSLERATLAYARARWAEAIGEYGVTRRSLARVSKGLSLALGDLWVSGSSSEWKAEAEVFLASRVLGFVRHVLMQIRCLLSFLVVALIGIMLATASYPFQPKALMFRFNILIVVFVVASVLKVLVEIDRDHVLSIAARGESERVTWNREFVGRLTAYVALPVLGFIATHFPDLGALVSGWVDLLGGR